MQSWILAFALVLAAGSAVAEDATVPDAGSPAAIEPAAVPPIPGPSERTEPLAPLAGTWPAAPAGSAVAVTDEAGSPFALPPIPAPELSAPVTRAPELAEVPAPKVRPPFDPAGTVHVVETGDTLWDISDLYLGTPWIWPSVWSDNDDIENPHLILPGDKIWVSATEMRKITDEEAAALLAGDAPVPAALAEDVLPVPVPEPSRGSFQYMEMATVGVVTKKELRGYGRMVGTIEEAILISQGDTVFIDLGEADTAVADQFVMFRTTEKVYDPSTHRPIGHYSQVVGWLEVKEVYEETARARVQMSYIDFMPHEVYLKPRELAATEVAIKESPPDVEGQIVDLLVDPKYRGGGDVIVLNRGSEHGLEPGSPLEVYRPVSQTWKKVWYGSEPDATIPHEVVGDLLVLSVQAKTAMAYVRKSNTELWYGDRFRTVNGPSVEWPPGGIFAIPYQVMKIMALVPDVDMPEVSIPDEVAGWNVPRLYLPTLEGYDPR